MQRLPPPDSLRLRAATGWLELGCPEEALAELDSDGDGFTNGRELGDPLGLWRPGMPFPGTCSCVSRPGSATFTSAC